MQRRYIWQIGDRVGNDSQQGIIVAFAELHPIIKTSPSSVTTASQQVLEQSFGWRLIARADEIAIEQNRQVGQDEQSD